MDVINNDSNKIFRTHLRYGWSYHHADHPDSIGFTFWSEILQSAEVVSNFCSCIGIGAIIGMLNGAFSASLANSLKTLVFS